MPQTLYCDTTNEIKTSVLRLFGVDAHSLSCCCVALTTAANDGVPLICSTRYGFPRQTTSCAPRCGKGQGKGYNNLFHRHVNCHCTVLYTTNKQRTQATNNGDTTLTTKKNKKKKHDAGATASAPGSSIYNFRRHTGTPRFSYGYVRPQSTVSHNTADWNKCSESRVFCLPQKKKGIRLQRTNTKNPKSRHFCTARSQVNLSQPCVRRHVLRHAVFVMECNATAESQPAFTC